ncbi:lysine 5,6-aminomutase reactivase ATPase KamC [Labilibaculum antarcticum]|uniref:DNA mismatch repair protein MutS n=1 Tax=Labilibaculum antarcticum TaxID=1717717 RepID=A0A1Y1CMU6_9BACT|nr:DNA mismatch repair protein MutS [Labilibaculum antarcticum]BAX80591.1 DNA mismatch repair protein MutS [Labilibaculum antarcticum]
MQDLKSNVIETLRLNTDVEIDENSRQSDAVLSPISQPVLFREVAAHTSGLQFLMEDLDLRSPMGRRYLLDSKLMCCEKEISAELNFIDQLEQALELNSDLISKIQSKLSHLRDIRGSVNNLIGNLVLDDVELFEIKLFALLAQEIVELQKEGKQSFLEISDLSQLIRLLDPQNTKIPSFYIYDNYSEELAEARKELKLAKSKNGESDLDIEVLFAKMQEIEANVREELCTKISQFGGLLANALNQLAHLDLLIAKAVQAKKWDFSKAETSEGETSYTGMFNPMIKNELANQNKEYQAIDIDLERSVCLITGANMAGKTVVLKTLALCQYLFQFGFFVPATSAQISIVDKVMISVGDEQSELNGLSSFASEMLNVSRMVKDSKNQNNVLILIDELARTTNPVEGLAIVNAVADIFYQGKIRSVITTHYSGLKYKFRKLRVKGLDKDLGANVITYKNINSYMDYSLVEDLEGEVPHEALRIASLLGIDKEIIERAQNHLNEETSKENTFIKG